jgi:hypothetical protein
MTLEAKFVGRRENICFQGVLLYFQLLNVRARAQSGGEGMGS